MARQQRLLITFSERAYNSLKAFSDASGIAAASLVSQLIEGSIDNIDQMTDVFIQAKQQPAKSIEIMLNAVNRQQDALETIESDLERFTVAKGRGKRSQPKKELEKKTPKKSKTQITETVPKRGRPRKTSGDNNA